MKYKNLNNTDLRVSSLCLGTVEFGAAVEKEECFKQLDEFLELGGNFLDTAHVYGDWVPGESARSEKVIGEWMKRSGKRNHCVITTKGAHPRLDTMEILRVNRQAILTDLEESLTCLGTDTIDLYLLHRDDKAVPVEEILDTLEGERRKGKIRYYGCSNWSLKRLKEAQRTAEAMGITGFVCNQLMWSLADINRAGIQDPTLVQMDEEIFEFHKEKQINVMAYMAAAKGYFHKLLEGTAMPEKVAALYKNETNDRIAGMLYALKENGITPVQACVAYFAEQPFPAVPLASFRNLAQMRETAAGCDVALGEDVSNRLAELKRFVE